MLSSETAGGLSVIHFGDGLRSPDDNMVHRTPNVGEMTH
jgi:hypothetical protein